MDVPGDLSLQWVSEVGNVIHEEVICGLESDLTTPVEEEVVGDCEEVPVGEIVETIVQNSPQHAEEILMVPQSNDMESIYIVPQDQSHDYLNIQVTEEVITDNWDRSGPEDGDQIPVTKVSHDNLLEYDDMEIPLPIDQDSYTSTRPFPCDFCSRRFRKKANLMNHMVAHQTDRPHGCNLCGARYVRKCDLMTHLKIHAYAPERDGMEDEEFNEDDLLAREEDERGGKGGRRKKAAAPRRRKANVGAKKNVENAQVSKYPLNKSYDYIDEDVRLVEEMSTRNAGANNYPSSSRWTEEMPSQRWPVTDPTKPYVCQFCGIGFAREKALQSHSRMHASDGPYECTKCNEMFWDMSLLKEHIRIKHGENLQMETETFENEATYTGDERFGEFYCETCHVPFHRLDLLKRHRKIHVKSESQNMDGAEQHHVCNVCGEWFEEALALLAHAESHASRSPSRRCLMCGERCRDDADLVEHVRLNHMENASPNMCVMCGKICKDKRSLIKHSWVHSNDKSFCCTKCGKRFHSKARLRRHMVSHRNKMVACEECGEEFPDGRALVSHRHSHNKELGGRTFPCRECGKTFGSRSSQQIHIRIHTGERPYGCRFCWKAFADGGTLRKHERIHTGEKPYVCAICPRAFNQRVVLREHVRAHHSGPDPKCHGSMTPYLCKVCNDTFATSEEVVAHIVQHCDENTAQRRQPQTGPRKYKRRRKLKPHEPDMLTSPIAQRANEPFELLNMPSDSDDNTPKRKVVKRTKQQHRTNVEEGYQNVLKGFESSLQNINSIVGSTKPGNAAKNKLAKKVKKKDEKKIEAIASSSQQPSRPKMIHTQKTRVPVEIGSDGAKKGQKTKTMVTRTPKVMPAEHKMGIFPGGERNRPRTKNVSYHVEGKLQVTPAVFPKESGLESDQVMINVKIEPGLQRSLAESNNDHSNNNGNMLDTSSMDVMDDKRKVTPMTRRKRRVLIKQEPREPELQMEEISNNNNTDASALAPAQEFEIVDGNDMEVAFEAHVTTEESILPDMIKPGREEETVTTEIEKENVNNVSLNQSNMVVQNLLQSEEETIIPDTVVYTCHLCQEVFSSRDELLSHVPVHI